MKSWRRKGPTRPILVLDDAPEMSKLGGKRISFKRDEPWGWRRRENLGSSSNRSFSNSVDRAACAIAPV
jgi:hypothetical protein